MMMVQDTRTVRSLFDEKKGGGWKCFRWKNTAKQHTLTWDIIVEFRSNFAQQWKSAKKVAILASDSDIFNLNETIQSSFHNHHHHRYPCVILVFLPGPRNGWEVMVFVVVADIKCNLVQGTIVWVSLIVISENHVLREKVPSTRMQRGEHDSRKAEERNFIAKGLVHKEVGPKDDDMVN